MGRICWIFSLGRVADLASGPDVASTRKIARGTPWAEGDGVIWRSSRNSRTETVGDRKRAGILAEVAPSETVIVVGVGLNATLSPDEAGDPAAASSFDLDVEEPDHTLLTSRLLHDLAAASMNGGPSAGPTRARVGSS
jgi:hypothetical protein